MHLKLKAFIIATAVLFSVCAYKVDTSIAESWDVAPATTRVVFKTTLTSAIPFIGANVPFDLGYKGAGASLVIIDTGIEKAHPFFQNRVILEACFANRCPNGQTSMIGSGAAAPVHWHGTHVAGIAAGSSSSVRGVAPEASIIAINVFEPSGAAYDGNIIKALQWVSTIASQYNVASVNMSLGGSQSYKTTCDDYIPRMTSAIKALKDINVATVISSGNSYANGMSAPACISHAVSVAATYTNSNIVTDFSNINSYTTIAAPGHNINSSKLLGSFGAASGTSMASPFVTGAFALYRSVYGNKSVNEVINIFKTNSQTAIDSYTKISISRIHLSNVFTGTPVPTSSTTSTILNTTTTTLPSPTTSTTLPYNPPISTTTTTTTIPKYVFIPKPLLLEVNGLPKTYVWIKYRDPYMNKSYISHYLLTCNGINQYTIPLQSRYSLHSYKLNVPASAIDYCYLQAVALNGSKTFPTTVKYIYPKNKISSSLTISKTPKKKNAKSNK
jgi:subtilisin family serine protease